MAAKERYRYLYRRERPNGTVNETKTLGTFEKWLRELEQGDRFYVARCDWVECQHDKMIRFGKLDIPHVVLLGPAESKSNNKSARKG